MKLDLSSDKSRHHNHRHSNSHNYRSHQSISTSTSSSSTNLPQSKSSKTKLSVKSSLSTSSPTAASASGTAINTVNITTASNKPKRKCQVMCIACNKTSTASLHSHSSLHSIASSSDLELASTGISSCSIASTGASSDSSMNRNADTERIEFDADADAQTLITNSSSTSGPDKSPNCTSTDTGKDRTIRSKRRVRFAPQYGSSAVQTHVLNLDCGELDNTSKYSVKTDIIDIIKPASSMNDHERSQCFWQLKDYEYFRGTAQIIASEVLKVTNSQPPSSHSYNAVLTRAYDLCAVISESSFSESKSSSSKSTTSCNDDPMVIPPHLFAALTHWVKAGHSRRGLEKFCVTSHMQSRPMAKAATVQAVLLAQELLRTHHPQSKEKCNQNSNKNVTKFHIGESKFPLDLPQDEILRLVSERFSKTSRYFGTAIGHADAAAVGNYQHCEL